MAEGLLGGILGGGDAERPETEASAEATSSAEAFAAALAADQAKHDPAVAEAAAEFLRRQSRLLQAQIDQLNEQNPWLMAHLRGQKREGWLRRFGQRLRLSVQVATALIALVIVAGLGVMLHDAFASKSVVVDPFDAPSTLAARGLSGKVVAAGVLDELTRLQTATRSSLAKRNLSNAWSNEVRLEVPQTGMSLSEIDRLLKSRFGHDLHVGGDLVQAEDGQFVLTVRGDAMLPKSFTGAPGDLAKLATQAAEYVYGQSQPGGYVVYLTNQGRDQEATAFAKAIYPGLTDPEERAYVLNGWANASENVGRPLNEALSLYQAAAKAKPDYWNPYANIANTMMILGREEDALQEMRLMLKLAGGRPGKAPEILFQNGDYLSWNLLPWRDGVAQDAATHGGVGSAVGAAAPSLADIDARLHDPAAAEFELRTGDDGQTDPAAVALIHFVHGRMAAEAGDTARAVAEMEAFGVGYANPEVGSQYPGYNCWIAPAEEAAGRPDKADAVLATGGRFVDCYRFRADILDHRSDWAGAQRAYAAAAAIAPDLPAAYYSWGVALARHGDLEGALAKLAEASARGPGWADPVKAAGDVLARQGKWQAALAKYQDALKLAPAWAALRQARDAAAAKA